MTNCTYSAIILVFYERSEFHAAPFHRGFDRESEYTRKAFFNCVMKDAPITGTPSETAVKYYTIQEGTCEGTIIGGNLCTLNLLQGTPYQ